MFNRLYQYLQTNSILALEQFGFRKGSYMGKVVFALTGYILSSLNLRQQIGGIFCDLSKAFDCVNHEILIAKLHYYGIHEVVLNWFKSYITNRKQKVKITSQNGKKESSSRWETIKNGVPQGSILGPLLFIIYVNDSPQGINQFVNPVIYADDTSVLVSAQNLEDLKSNFDFTLHYISDWFFFNGLTLNMDKTNIIKFSSSHFQNPLHQGESINVIRLQILIFWGYN